MVSGTETDVTPDKEATEEVSMRELSTSTDGQESGRPADRDDDDEESTMHSEDSTEDDADALTATEETSESSGVLASLLDGDSGSESRNSRPSEEEEAKDVEIPVTTGRKWAINVAPKTIASLAKALDMSGSMISLVPTPIAEYVNLSELNLANNRLMLIQPELLSLKKLQVVILASNGLAGLPDDLPAHWPDLQRMDISENLFSALPKGLLGLKKLEYIRIGHNRLKELPEEVSQLSQLKVLSLEHNAIETLPSSLSTMRNLKNLVVNNNKLQELPAGVEKLQLTALYIANNPGAQPMTEALPRQFPVDTRATEQPMKLVKSWSSKIGLKPKEGGISKKKSGLYNSTSSVKRKSATHDEGMGLYRKKSEKKKDSEKKPKDTEKKSGDRAKKKKSKKSNGSLEKVQAVKARDLLPGKFQNGINFALTGSELRVRGSTPDRLIALLTYDSGIDLQEYQRAFMTIYPEFLADGDLLSALQARYDTGGSVGKDRVVKLLNLWITTHKARFFEDSSPLKDDFCEFCKSTLGSKGDSLVALLGRLEKRAKTTEDSWKTLHTKTKATPAPFHRSGSVAQVAESKDVGSWMDLKPKKLAEQLTLISHSQFKLIEVGEWLNTGWLKTDIHGVARSPNLVSFIEWTNHESALFATAVCSKKTANGRAHMITRILSTAEKCIELNNYSTAWSIYSAVNNAAIAQQRLKNSWELVPAKAIKILHDLELLFDMSNNFGHFRTQMKKVKPPCIPSVMLVTKDLIFMDEGNPKELKDGSINYELYSMKASTILNMRDLQRLGYDDFVALESVQKDICTFEVLSNDELYERSQVFEPRGADSKLKGGTLRAKKRQTFRSIANKLFSDEGGGREMSQPNMSTSSISPRNRAQTLSQGHDDLVTKVKLSESQPVRKSLDDSSLPSSTMSANRKKSLEMSPGRQLVRDDSQLALKKTASEARGVDVPLDDMDAGCRVTVKPAFAVDYEAIAAKAVARAQSEGQVQTPVVERSASPAGSGAPGTGLTRRPLNFLAPPLPTESQLRSASDEEVYGDEDAEPSGFLSARSEQSGSTTARSETSSTPRDMATLQLGNMLTVDDAGPEAPMTERSPRSPPRTSLSSDRAPLARLGTPLPTPAASLAAPSPDSPTEKDEAEEVSANAGAETTTNQ